MTVHDSDREPRSDRDNKRPDSDTDTVSDTNLSTEHQREGDARRPRDTLDRDADDTPGGLPQEDVEDRPSAGQVRPEDYPDR